MLETRFEHDRDRVQDVIATFANAQQAQDTFRGTTPRPWMAADLELEFGRGASCQTLGEIERVEASSKWDAYPSIEVITYRRPENERILDVTSYLLRMTVDRAFASASFTSLPLLPNGTIDYAAAAHLLTEDHRLPRVGYTYHDFLLKDSITNTTTPVTVNELNDMKNVFALLFMHYTSLQQVFSANRPKRES